MGHVLYVDNTGYIQLQGYKNSLTNEYINDAIVTAEFTHKDGSSVGGLLPLISLSYEVGSDGSYSATISENALYDVNDVISAKVTAVSSGIKSTFHCKVLIKERKA